MKAICSVVTILINKPMNNLLEFHFQRQPKTIAFHIIRHKWSSANCKPTALLLKFQPGHFFALEIGRVIRECIFYSACSLGQLKPYSNFFTANLAVEPFQRNTEDVVCSFVLLICFLLQQSNYLHFFAILQPNNRI